MAVFLKFGYKLKSPVAISMNLDHGMQAEVIVSLLENILNDGTGPYLFPFLLAECNVGKLV